jgi:hypothetical protein
MMAVSRILCAVKGDCNASKGRQAAPRATQRLWGSDAGAHAERRRLRCRSGWPKALLDRDPLDAGRSTSPTSNESVDAVDGRPGPRSNSENRGASPLIDMYMEMNGRNNNGNKKSYEVLCEKYPQRCPRAVVLEAFLNGGFFCSAGLIAAR